MNASGMPGCHRRGKPVAKVRANELDGKRVVAVREDGVELRGKGVHLISRRVDQVGGEVRTEACHLCFYLCCYSLFLSSSRSGSINMPRPRAQNQPDFTILDGRFRAHTHPINMPPPQLKVSRNPISKTFERIIMVINVRLR